MLTVHDVSVRFGGVHALDGLTFEVERGERIGVIGPNGAGKSTLLDVLSGVRRTSHGCVLFEEVEVSKLGPTKVSRLGLHRTFQRHQPFGWLSVEDNVLVALEWRGRGRRIMADVCALPKQGRRYRQHLAHAHELLELCGLSAARTRSAASLPIGQIRLLEFARAIADQPKLVLLDEPTSGLAQSDAARLGQVIREVNQSVGTACILVEHDVDFVVALSKRMLVLDQGRLLADGYPTSVLQMQEVVEAYIGRDAVPPEGK